MTSGVISADIDHVGVAGRDMPGLLEAYGKMGFKLTTPEPLMGIDADGNPVSLGQVSAHFMFADSYVELSAVTGEKPNNHLEPSLARYEGLHILALAAEDADRARADLDAAGLNPGAVQGAGREIHYGKGGSARFAWFAFAPGTFPEAFVCMVQQRTPDVVFQPEMTDHPNGALDLLGVYLVARDGAASLKRYQPFANPDTHRFVDIMDVEEAACRFPGVSIPAGGDCLLGMKIRVRDLDALKVLLTAGGVPFRDRIREPEGDVLVMPDCAGGALVVFSQ